MYSEEKVSAIEEDDFKIFNVSTSFIRIMPTEKVNQNNMLIQLQRILQVLMQKLTLLQLQANQLQMHRVVGNHLTEVLGQIITVTLVGAQPLI